MDICIFYCTFAPCSKSDDKMALSEDSFRQLSHSIACVRFPLVLSIIFLHAYTASSVGHGMYFKALYPFSIWLGETGVPAYFFISGLLMFYSTKSYSQKIKSRLGSLFIPYMLWNSLFLLVYVLLWGVGFDVKINYKSLADYGIIDIIRAYWDRGSWDDGNGMPVLTPMWYVRNLMILYLISPFVYYAIRTTGLLIPIVAALFWMTTHTVAYSLQTLTMFFLGAYFPICAQDPIKFWRRYKRLLLLAFFLIGLCDMSLHQFITLDLPYDINQPIHRLSLIFNSFIIVLWLGNFMYEKGWRFPSLSEAAFFIFCTHQPLIAVIRAVTNRFPQWSDYAHILIYFITVFVVTLVCYGLFWILRRYAPWFIRISTGGRGT